MATYKDLYGLVSESALRNRVTTAVIVAAETIRTEPSETTNHTAVDAAVNIFADGS